MSVRLPAPARRAQLLETALVVFADKGFHDTSMNDVADAAGVTKPVLYQHFASKRELYRELLDHVGTQLLDTLVGSTGVAGGAREQVEIGFHAFFGFVAENRAAYRLLFWGGNRRDDEFAQTIDRVEDAIAGAVTELLSDGLDPVHRRTLAYSIVGLAEVVSRHWVADEFQASPEAVAAQVSELAWCGLRGIRTPEG